MSTPHRIAPMVLLGTFLALGGCAQKKVDPRVAAFAALPDWSGVWAVEGGSPGVDGFPQIAAEPGSPIPQVTDGPGAPAPPGGERPLTFFNLGAPLKPEMRASMQKELAAKQGNVAQSSNGSGGWGYPIMMQSPAPLQFFITPEETQILNSYRDLRRIFTDGKARQPKEDRWPPTTWGDSRGHWEGDTLVIDTIDVREPRQYFGLSFPFSGQAHYTERLRKTGPDRIEGEMIIEDPVTLISPMSVKLVYVRSKEVEQIILDTFSNNRSGFDGEFNTIEPAK